MKQKPVTFFARIPCCGCSEVATVEVVAADAIDNYPHALDGWISIPDGYCCSARCLEGAKKNAIDAACAEVHKRFSRYMERAK